MSIASIEMVAAAVGRQMDAVVDEVVRQTRWRPTWFVKAHRGDEQLHLVVRGNRVDTALVPLRHEMEFHRILCENDMPVPKLHGWNDEIDAFVMDFVPGTPDLLGVPEADRDQVVDEYLQALVRLHSLDPAPFLEAGLLAPDSPETSGTVTLFHMERLFRDRKTEPHPLMEFCLGWARRHPPVSNGRMSPVVWDSGQFHHRDGHLLTMLDLEFGHLGDPMEDLAVWRMRSTLIPYGHFPSLYARYEELSGRSIDMEALKLHYFVSTLANELVFAESVKHPESGSDLMTNMQWNSETNLMATEALGELLGIELPTVDMPDAMPKRTDAAFDHLIRTAREIETSEPTVQYELRRVFRMARHLKRSSEIGDAVIQADLDDLADLLGTRPATWWEGDQALEKFVLDDAAVGKYDVPLIQVLHRRNLRVHMLMGPEGSSMTKHYPAPRFDAS